MTRTEKLKTIKDYCHKASAHLWWEPCDRFICKLCGGLFHSSRCIHNHPERYNDDEYLDESFRIVEAERRKDEECKKNNPFLGLEEER